MIRTTISLDEREYELAKEEAHALGISVAEFVRRAVRNALPPTADGPWRRFAGLVETGDSKSSQSIDEIREMAERADEKILDRLLKRVPDVLAEPGDELPKTQPNKAIRSARDATKSRRVRSAHKKRSPRRG